MDTIVEKLQSLEGRYQELESRMAQPEIAADQEQLQALAKERAGLEDVVGKYRDYKAASGSLEGVRSMLNDSPDGEMVALIKEEMSRLESRREALLQELRTFLLPKERNDQRDVIVEIRAGTGGEEASLFAADLFRMYTRYAQLQGWGVEVIDSSESSANGFKEIVFEIKGKGAFSKLKYERGVHRVQRVPVTESSGRIHTSTATVAVLPEAEEVEVNIRPEDLKMDFFHASGAGGQNVNKVATAVRITHLPTGLVAVCQDERSQVKNRLKAMAVLRARLLNKIQQRQLEEITQDRRSQVGSGERAEKIRTYNFPQDRVTDHRISLSLHGLENLLDGGLDRLTSALAAQEQEALLEKLGV